MSEENNQAAPAPAESSSGAVPSPSEMMGSNDILAFDPFQPPKPAAAPKEESIPAPEAPLGKAPPSRAKGKEVPPSEAPAAAPQPAAPQAPNYDRIIAEQQATIRALLERQGQPAAPQAPGAPTGPQPKFNMGIPPQIIAGLRSENEQETAASVYAIVNGVANAVWNEVQKYISDEVVSKMPAVAGSVVSQHSTQRNIHDDFYSAHPALYRPELLQLVQLVGMQVAQARQAQGRSLDWTPELREEIASAVYSITPHLRPQATQPASPPAKPPAGPFVSNGGTRQATPSLNEFQQLLKSI